MIQVFEPGKNCGYDSQGVLMVRDDEDVAKDTPERNGPEGPGWRLPRNDTERQDAEAALRGPTPDPSCFTEPPGGAPHC